MREILKEPDERLRKKSKRISKITPDIRKLAKEMIDIMRNSERPGIGLAAPQIGMLLRIITIGIGEKNIVLINPEIAESSNPVPFQEGCLSVPGVYSQITRPKKVFFRYIDIKGKRIESMDEGIFARVLQHEIDHLNGKLFIDYLTPDSEIELEDGAEIPESLINKFKKG
ncbi:MAG: peptide deformylase [Caldisericia bacterium]|nr:peptide deformylase [Caldisericia bacterium]